MKTTEFCYWLQGYFELYGPKTIDEKETELIKRHLALVFQHDIDPSYVVGDVDPDTKQALLQAIHDGKDNADIQLGGTDEAGNVYRC